MSKERTGGPRTTQIVGGGLLVSAVLWWEVLRAWAVARFGSLDVDATGSTPILWTLLIVAAALLFLTRALPRRRDNVRVAAAFLLCAFALAVPNIAANVDDGISAPGLLLAALSVTQALVVLFAVVGDEAQTATRRR